MSRPHNDDDVFRAISHPTRRKILLLLADRERTGGELAGSFATSWPTTSTHLRVLRAARLVRARRKGRNLVYAITAENLSRVQRWVDGVRPSASPVRPRQAVSRSR